VWTVSAQAGDSDFHVERLIRAKRELLGLSRRELGRRCDLSVAYVSAVETGRIAPSLRAFARLAMELQFSSLEMLFVVNAEAVRPMRGRANEDQA